MLKKITENEGLMFMIKIISVYLLWTIIRKTFNNTDALYPYWTSFNDIFAAKYVAVSSWVLENWFGYDLLYNKRNILPKGSSGVFVGNHCLGVSAKFIFIGIILTLKGKLFNKIWFVLLGVSIIVLINLTRIVMLAKQLTEGDIFWFNLNHSYIYVLLVYSVIFGLIMVWEKYFAQSTEKE